MLTTGDKTTSKQTQKKQRFAIRHISDSITTVRMKETTISSVLDGSDSHIANMKKTQLRKRKFSEGRNENDGTKGLYNNETSGCEKYGFSCVILCETQNTWQKGQKVIPRN
jgi:hypothetical protein